MNKQVVNNSFVVYATYYEVVKELEQTDPEKAFALLKAIMDYGFYGEYDDSDIMIKLLMKQIGFGIDKSNDRYAKAVENGKKGGRPSTIDKGKIIYLHNQGMTNRQVADELNCSLSTVEKTISKYKKDNNFLTENRKNPQNLNYNYNYNENYNSNDNIFNTGEKEGSTVITYEEFLRLGETREMRLINNNKEAIIDETGEILTVVGAPLPFNKIAK